MAEPVILVDDRALLRPEDRLLPKRQKETYIVPEGKDSFLSSLSGSQTILLGQGGSLLSEKETPMMFFRRFTSNSKQSFLGTHSCGQ